MKEGYKQTAVGVIPEEWDTTLLKQVGEWSGGGTPSKKQNTYWEHGTIPWATSLDIKKTNLYKTKYLITLEGLENSTSTLIPIDSIIMVVRSGILRHTFPVTINRIEVAINQDLKALKCNGKFDKDFIQGLLLLKNKYILETCAKVGTTVESIDYNSLKSFPIPLPPLPEQQKIAEVLGTWDKAIETCQCLIRKLKTRNRGLAQQLLTGTTRLPGFEGEWEEKRISNIAGQQSLLNKENEEIEVLSCTKYDGLVRSLDYFGRQVYGSDLSKYKVVPNGSFAYATNHIEEGSIGYQDIMEKGLVSPMYTVFKTKSNIEDTFLFRLLKTDEMIYKYQSNMSGSINRRGGLRWKDFSSIKLHIPSLQEQTAIADILQKAEDELKLYQEKLAALQLQKKGLMQKLLTGEVRVNC